MKLHELTPAAGSRRGRTRVGRGISAGQGKTSGRGQKGAGAREGAKVPRAFEGGQMPLTQRLPKLRWFTNRWRTEYTVLNVSKLNRFDKGAIVDGAALADRGLVGHAGERVKLLAAGRVKVAVTVRVHRASDAARRAVEAAGGRVELLEEGGVRRRGVAALALADEAEPPAAAETIEVTSGDASPEVEAVADDTEAEPQT